MRILYETLDFLPEMARQPIVAFLVIIIGYFLSKISAALLSSIVPSRRHIIRSGFWICWLVFIIMGYNQIPLLSSSLKHWVIGPENYTAPLFIILGGSLLLAMDKSIVSLNESIKGFLSSNLPLKLNGVFRFINAIVWIPLVVIGGWALDDPQTKGLKLTATLLLLLLGYLLAHVVKATITSLISREIGKSHLVTKFLFYCVCVTFLITAIGIWI